MNFNISTHLPVCKLILISLLFLSCVQAVAQCSNRISGNTALLKYQRNKVVAVIFNENKEPGEIATDSQLNLMVIIGILIILLVVSISLYNTYYLKRNSKRLLAEKQKKINEQNLALQHLITSNDRLLDEKDWLLKEVHHRVKNNLQIVMSLLNTQSAFLKNNAALAAIRESQNRVQSIALIHQKLYSDSDVAYIDIAVYINELINYLDDCYNAHDKGIRFEQAIEPVKMDVAQAIPVGLMLNEAITNAIKYAFEAGRGIIRITLTSLDNHTVALKISDNGVGLPAGFNIKDTSSLGMEMMKALSRQLNGNFTIGNDNGVLISLVFAIEKKFGSGGTEAGH